MLPGSSSDCLLTVPAQPYMEMREVTYSGPKILKTSLLCLTLPVNVKVTFYLFTII